MALNFEVTFYLVNKLLSIENISRNCLIIRYKWVMVPDKVIIYIWRCFSISIYKPLLVSWVCLYVIIQNFDASLPLQNTTL